MARKDPDAALSAIDEYATRCADLVRQTAAQIQELRDAHDQNNYERMTAVMQVLFDSGGQLETVAIALTELATNQRTPVPDINLPEGMQTESGSAGDHSVPVTTTAIPHEDPPS